MRAKPAGLGPEYTAQFDDESVVAAYDARPPYPESLLALIRRVAVVDRPRLIDLGCGTAELTRRLAPHVDAVVAIDRSLRMIAAAKHAPGGDAPNITWIVGDVESAPLPGPFDVAIAAESFHWFDWPRACTAIADHVPSRMLVLAEGRFEVGTPWSPALAALIAVHSTNRRFVPYDLVGELLARGLFKMAGRTALGPERFEQTVDDYVRSIHSRNGFSRDRMSPASAHAFDEAVRGLVAPHAQPTLELKIETRATWGRVVG